MWSVRTECTCNAATIRQSSGIASHLLNNELTLQKCIVNKSRHTGAPWRQDNQVYEPNRKVLSERLKEFRDTDEWCCSDDRVFQVPGPDAENARGTINVPYFCTYIPRVIQFFCMKNGRPAGYTKMRGVQIAFYTILWPCQRCNKRLGDRLSHYFIDGVHQLDKSHSLCCSSCRRRLPGREELTRDLDIPPQCFPRHFPLVTITYNMKIFVSDINFRLD